MIRLCLTIACLGAVACTQASADNLSPDPLKTPRPHVAKAKHPMAQKSASVDNALHFSDPYAPPEGTTVVRKTASLPHVTTANGRPAALRPIDCPCPQILAALSVERSNFC